jgi:hypothetical protein
MSASFPGVAMGSSNSQTITLRNGGNATLTISGAHVAGAGFGTTGLTLPMHIGAGQSATFNLVFAPKSAGNVTGSISLTSNAPNSPLAISASATALSSAALLSASASSLDFGGVVVGGNSSLGVLLSNVGNGNVTISSLMVTGAGFAASGAGVNTTMAPGQTAALNVTFTPSAAGSVAGSLTIGSNGGGLSIALAGSGTSLSGHAVALNWDASTSDVVAYNVYRQRSDGTYGKINPAPSVGTRFWDTNLVSGQTYTYVVTTLGTDNEESHYSDPVSATIP